MSNISSNLISSIFTNSITVIFLIAITLYMLVRILENRNLYNFINTELIELNSNYKNSKLYINAKSKYSVYQQENPYLEINMTSFIEEVASDFRHKNKPMIEEIRSIKGASSTCILLGVLGTFVGLSMMLLNVDTKNIIDSLPNTISSMQTAFTTSIFGIICSMIINFSTKINNCEHVMVQIMLKLENLITSDVTHVKSERVDSKIEEVKSTIKQISKSIEAIERFDKISKDLTEFNEEFIGGIEVLKGLLEGSQNSIKTFDQNIRKLDKQFNILNIKFNRLFENYDKQEDINKEILLDIKESAKSIYDLTENQYRVSEYMRNLSATFGLYERSAQDLLLKLVDREDNIIDNQRDIYDRKISLEEDLSNLSTIISNASKDIEDKLDMMFNYLDLYKEASGISSIKDKNYIVPSNEEIYEIEKEYSIIKDIDEDDLND